MKLPTHRESEALRTLQKTFPVEDEATTLRWGNLTIVTKRPSFWAANARAPSTYGEYLDALMDACEADYQRRLAQWVDKPELDQHVIRVARSNALKVKLDAERKHREAKSSETWAVLDAATQAFEVADKAVKDAHTQQVLRDSARRNSFKPVQDWVEEVFRDFDVELHQGCDADDY